MIEKYKVELDSKRHPFLVRERGYRYDNVKMDAPEKIVDMVNECFNLCNMAEEHVYMVALNSAAVVTGVFEVSHGVVNYALINPRELYLRAVILGAVGIVVIHNHPSGDIHPSKEDRAACMRIRDAGDIMGIALYDFIIIGHGCYLSFHEESMLSEKTVT